MLKDKGVTMRIEVVVSELELSRVSNAAVEPLLMAKLKSKGIPVKGSTIFAGVERGILSVHKDPETANTHFVWDDAIEKYYTEG